MPIYAKMWKINEEDKLSALAKIKLDFEERIHKWLEDNILVISDNYIVIGSKIGTDFGKEIDLLCIDRNGDAIIVELKRDKTPKEVTSQILEYASWINELSRERIIEIADDYLHKKDKGSLEDVFTAKFNVQDLPETLNGNHKMIIVGSEIDTSSERIIKYLSDGYGVPINAITFQIVQDDNEQEFLTRAFLIDPLQVDYATQTKSPTKTRRVLTFVQAQEIANSNGVGKMYEKLFSELSAHYFDSKRPTGSTIAFEGIMGEEEKKNTIFSLVPGESDSEKGLMYRVYTDRFAEYYGKKRDQVIDILPQYVKKDITDSGENGYGYFKEDKHVNKFLSKLSEWDSEWNSKKQ